MLSDKDIFLKNPFEARAREHVRRLVEENRRHPGLDGPVPQPRPITSVGIVGAGWGGTALAAAVVRRHLPVAITDTDHRLLADAPRRVSAELAAEMPPADATAQTEKLLRTWPDARPVFRCDLVIEAITESALAKSKLYAEWEGELCEGGVLASNTSTLPIGQLAAGLRHPERFCGIHFCQPIGQRPVVEVVRGPRTSPQVIATVVAYLKAIGRMPIVVQDGPGFLVNRLLFPYVSEALELLLDGVPPDAIERAATLFGMDMGPLHLLDEIGLDTVLRAGMNLSGAFVERMSASPLLVRMVKAGRMGRKSGAGFFDYPQPAHLAGPGVRPEAPRLPSTAELLAEFATTSLADASQQTPQAPPAHAITARLVLAMLIEAIRLWEERKVSRVGDIDLGAIFGLGFPESRGGLLWWADTLGAARLLALLQPLARLGQRWQPPPLLVEMARRRQPFYASRLSS